MLKEVLDLGGDKQVVLMDSISYVDDSDSKRVVVTGSHGGTSSGEYALRVHLAAVIFNDAGIGRQEAGIASLQLLQNVGVAAATVSHDSGMIGQAQDMWENGVLSHVNRAASEAGVEPGMSVQDAAGRLIDAYGT
jgi:uncharacterized protein YunC (DUF1805 family)